MRYHNSDAQQLNAERYVEEEFYVEGKANRYRIRDEMGNAQLIDKGHPYLTRARGRRIADPARFNGTVVVEWLNVSIGHDADFTYSALRELLEREGYAWVGVCAQHDGVEGLVQWNPTLYGKLTVAASHTDPLDVKDIDPRLQRQAVTSLAGTSFRPPCSYFAYGYLRPGT
jgi:hypothetical protein